MYSLVGISAYVHSSTVTTLVDVLIYVSFLSLKWHTIYSTNTASPSPSSSFPSVSPCLCSAFFSIILCHLFYSLSRCVALSLCRCSQSPVVCLCRLSRCIASCFHFVFPRSLSYPIYTCNCLQQQILTLPSPLPSPCSARSMQRVTCASSVIFRFASTPHNIFAVIFHM